MNAFSRPLPGKRFRTIASAQTIPKTVFTGTAIAVMISVSLKALIVSGRRERVPRGRERRPRTCARRRSTSGPTRIAAR